MMVEPAPQGLVDVIVEVVRQGMGKAEERPPKNVAASEDKGAVIAQAKPKAA